MSLDVGYSYCINLTDEEKRDIDKRVRNDQVVLKLAVFFPFLISPFPFPFPFQFPVFTIPESYPYIEPPALLVPQLPFDPVEGFTPPYPVRKAREQVEEEAIRRRDALLEPIYATAAQAQEAFDDGCEKFTVYTKMSSKLLKVSKKVRKDEETSKSLDKLEEQLKNGEFDASRGAKKLPGTKSIYCMRAGNRGRLFFRYSKEEKGAVEKLAESNKDKEQEVIDTLKKTYE